MGPSGFDNAPVTKGLMLASVGATLICSATNTRALLSLSNHVDVFRKHQLWRLFTHQMLYRSVGELLFGSILLYQFRVFERQMGSRKFGAFSFIVSTLSTTMNLALSVRGITNIAPGPYATIFASLVLYYHRVPASHRVRVFGIPLTNKFFIYLISLQLACCNWPGTAWAAACGVLSGLMFDSDILPLKKLCLPRAVTNLIGTCLIPIIGGVPSSPFGRARMQQQMQQRQQQQMRRQVDGHGYREQMMNYYAPGGLNVNNNNNNDVQYGDRFAEPSEENIAMLEGMGFPRVAAIQALATTNNNVQQAADLLLSH